MPAEAFGQAFSAWRERYPACVDSKGRSFKGRNCAKVDTATELDFWESQVLDTGERLPIMRLLITFAGERGL